MDLSKVFKANVKAIRMNSDNDGNDKDALNEQLGLKKTKKTTTILANSTSQQSKNIVANITLLKGFLQENKKPYVQPNYLDSGSSSTSTGRNNSPGEPDWAQFEDQVESIIKKCSDAIGKLKVNPLNVEKKQKSAQYREHFDNMVHLLEKYLKDVCKVYSEQRAIRVKRILEKKKYSQLYSSDIKNERENLESDSINDNHRLVIEEEEEEKRKNLLAEQQKNAESNLSAQELEQLEKENELMFDTFTAQTEEIKKVESDVIEVSRLTQIFTENIVSQLATVDSVHKSAIETNSNLTLGNESIKEAMKKNAALRLWILFIIVVLSFTLLFLDWYND
jgi:syntaxin 18